MFKILSTPGHTLGNGYDDQERATKIVNFMTVPRGSVSFTGAWANVLQSEFGGNAERVVLINIRGLIEQSIFSTAGY